MQKKVMLEGPVCRGSSGEPWNRVQEEVGCEAMEERSSVTLGKKRCTGRFWRSWEEGEFEDHRTDGDVQR